MDGFLIEYLSGREWHRGPDIRWSRADVEKTARNLVKRGAQAVRCVPVTVHLNRSSAVNVAAEAAVPA